MSAENNTNIAHINIIEGLMSQVNVHLHDIIPENPEQHTYKNQAIEEVDLLQRTTLHEMRKTFE